jgi:aspartyl-tRNA(Asn)/glutamyl-tRNA(Gln) amidotransferase subunit C
MISKEEVKKIAKLARIGITEKEAEKFQKEFSAILDYFDILKKIDTEKSEAKADYSDKGNNTREDKVFSQNEKTVKCLTDSFPDQKEGFIKVKAIF